MFVRVTNELVNEENQPKDSSRELALKQAAIEFGRRVKQLRRAEGLTQAQLAERLSQWGRSYHQTTVAKLEAGTRPTSLEELIPLAAALGVSQREFFEDPSPADQAAHRVRLAEQELLALRSEFGLAHTRLAQLRDELQAAAARYERLVAGLGEFDAAAAAERRQAVEDLKDLADTLRGDQL